MWKCYVFYYQHAKQMHRLRLAGCFRVVHVYAGHFRYKKIIPQQVKGKKKWAEIHHLLRLFVMNIHRTEQKAEHRVYA